MSRELLDRGTDKPVDDANDLCYDLPMQWPALWTFATAPTVEPTNSAAKRAPRPAVLWCTGSFGTQSTPATLFFARMLSVSATRTQQRRSLLA